MCASVQRHNKRFGTIYTKIHRFNPVGKLKGEHLGMPLYIIPKTPTVTADCSDLAIQIQNSQNQKFT